MVTWVLTTAPMCPNQGGPHARYTILRPALARPVRSRLLPPHLPTLPRPARRRHPDHRPPHRLQPAPHRRRAWPPAIPPAITASSPNAAGPRSDWRASWRGSSSTTCVPDGPVSLAGDDTVDEHRGAKVYGKGCHRDPVRSTHSYTAYRWGHKWVVLAILVQFPFATRPWALPVLVALYRSAGEGPKAKAQAARPRPRPRTRTKAKAKRAGPPQGLGPGPRRGGTRRPRN